MMIKKLREKWQPYMLRPLIYMVFTRFILALFVLLLADFFLSPAAGRSLKSTFLLLGAAVFALLAVIAWLRLDGIHLPKPLMLRVNPRKKPARTYGDIIDHIDETPQVSFEDLDDGEKDVCILGADLFCCVALVLIGALA